MGRDTGTIGRLATGIATLRRDLDALEADLDIPRAAETSADDAASAVSLLAIAKRVKASHNALGDVFDATLFVDPATNIILQLYIDLLEERVTTSGSCCAAAGVPRTTGLRWINLLCGRDLVEMFELESDRRSTTLRLTASGQEKAEEWLGSVRSLFYSGRKFGD